MVAMSAGILGYRYRKGHAAGGPEGIEVLLAHPGGPLWARKDAGAWSIPKGEYVDESPRDAALREFAEEVGTTIDAADLIDLGAIKQRSGKYVTAFATICDIDPATATSNTFTMMWPPKSGNYQEFPEVDRVQWFSPAVAAEKLNPAQVPFIDRLISVLADKRCR